MGNPGLRGFPAAAARPTSNAYLPIVTSGQTYNSTGSYYGDNGANCFNGAWSAESQCWLTNAINANVWVSIQFSNPVIVGAITIRNGSPSTNLRAAKDCRFDGSHDGSAWAKLPAIAWANGPTPYNADEFTLESDNSANPRLQTVQFNSQTPYRYYRLFCYNNYGNAYLCIAEVDLLRPASLFVITA